MRSDCGLTHAHVVSCLSALQVNFGTGEFAYPIPRMFDGVMAPRSLV
jgi:hypothetical protein